MANLKASKQDIKVNRRNQIRNKQLKTYLKTAIKRARLAIESINDSSASIVHQACRTIDKMVSKGIIKKNNAARNKSRLMVALNNAKSK